MANKEDLKLLKSYLKDLETIRDFLDETDFVPSDKIDLVTLQVARIADSYGLEGRLFRDWENVDDTTLYKQIEIVQKLIAELEKPVDRSFIPKNVAVIDVHQVAGLLNCTARVVYTLNDSGHLPKPWLGGNNTSTLKWNRKDFMRWLEAGQPRRSDWERQKEKEM